MNWNNFVLGALAILLIGCGTDKSSDSAGRSKDVAEIKNNAKAYEEAYNSYNAEKVASFWANNAEYSVPDADDTISGRTAITEYFKDFFDGKDRPKIDIVVDQVVFKGADKATEIGRVMFTYTDGSTDETAYQAQDIKENGKWFLQTVREVEIGKSTSNYDHLKDLNWLVGSWKDSEEDADIDLNFQWGINKNFLVEHFTVKVLNQEEMEGIQIIGWDPSLKKILSWVFDSDGGIRSGTWSKDGDNWVAVMKSTLSDGKKGSSLDIYTKGDGNHFTFSMNSREIDGDLLPDVGPVNFKKIKE